MVSLQTNTLAAPTALAAMASARCTRVDCASLCEELDLLRDDVLEIEWENKQLHEQLVALQSHVSTREAQMQQTLQRKDDEIFYLRETVAGFTTQLQQQLCMLQSEATDAARDLCFEKPLSVSSEQEFEALKTHNTNVEGSLKDLQPLVERKTVTGLKAQRQVTKVIEKSKDKCSELYTTLKVNEMLRDEEQRDLIHDLEARQDIVEKQLVEVEEYDAKYEQPASLENVLKYQNMLRAQSGQEQQMNDELCQEFNEQVGAAGKLQVVYERLKTEVGKPANVSDRDIADHLNSILATNEAVAKQTETQNYELEAERLRLLLKLRNQARLAGHKLYEQHGLTTEQWGAVEEFINRVRQIPEVAKRRLQPDYIRNEEQSSRRAKDQKDAMGELGREFDTRCEENAVLLKQIERPKNELEEAQSHPRSLAIPQPVTSSNDDRGENCCALEGAKAKSQRQERVLYNLRSEVTCRQVQDGDDDVSFATPEDEGFPLGVNKPESRQAERCTNVVRDQQEEVFQSLMDQHTVLCQHIFQMHAQCANIEIRLRAIGCTKYKGIASLVASQANVLTQRSAQEQGNLEYQEEQSRKLMASSEDHAIVDELQHQLMQIKANCQQFLVQYDLLTETQQQTLLNQQLETEKKAQELIAVREKSSDKFQISKTAIRQVNGLDGTAWSTKWKAFRKRLDALEAEMQVEQQRRKQLNKNFEDKQAQLPLVDLRQQCGDQSEIGRLKNQVDALKRREHLLMEQLQAVAKTTGREEKETRLQTELFETRILNEDLSCQLEAMQSRIVELLRLNGGLEADKRELRSKYKDLELDLQYARPGDGKSRQQSNLRDAEHGSSHSLLIRGNMELYKKDQAELQQATLVEIASLKQLVEEKELLLNEYQRKFAIVQASSAQEKAQDQLETTQLNKMLTEENQRMSMQLKEAMSAIRSVEGSGKSKQALEAAQERYEHILLEWKQAEGAVESARQSIRQLQMEQEVLHNERDLAESRAGEAREETVLLRGEEEMLKLLRGAIIKLKEEFLKVEDRHAVEMAKAQYAMNQDLCARKRKEKERREYEENRWQEEKRRLQSQVQMLQKKLALLKKKQNQQQRRKCNAEEETTNEKESALESGFQALRDEVERLKRLVKDKVVREAMNVEELEEIIKFLQVQNLALRVASTHAPVAPTDIGGAKGKREQFENERKLQRHVEFLTRRLKEKQANVISKNKELERYNERISNLESELQSEQAKHEKERLTQNARALAATSVSVKQQVEELEFQNAFPREILKKWETSFSAQMEKYEAQLQHLRQRLVQHGISLNNSTLDDDTDDTIGNGPNSRLQHEEQHFLRGEEVQAKVLAFGTELRSKEQNMVAKDTKLLELELENESLRLEYKRLQQMNQCNSGDMPGSEDIPKQRCRAKGVGNGGRECS